MRFGRLLLALNLTPTSGVGQVLYHVTRAGVPQGGNNSKVEDINQTGQLTGTSNTRSGNVAFLWDPGAGFTLLGDLAGGVELSQGYGLNAVGHVTGFSNSGTSEAFFWSVDTGMIGIGGPPGSGWLASYGHAINDRDEIAGYRIWNDGRSEAVWWDSDRAMHGVGDLSGGSFFSVAFDINDAGQVVGSSIGSRGYEAFLWTAQEGMVGLGDLPGGPYWSRAEAINDLGQIVGRSFSGRFFYEAFLWDPRTRTMRGLGALPGPAPVSEAIDINDHGQVIGWAAEDYRRGPEFDFIWDLHNGMRPLLPLIDAASRNPPPPSYFVMQHVYAINNLGQIAADAYFPGDPASRREAVVLMPFVLADMNCDQGVDAGDIYPFLVALYDPDTYAQKHPDCHADWAGDVNQDGVFDEADLPAFFRLFVRTAND